MTGIKIVLRVKDLCMFFCERLPESSENFLVFTLQLWGRDGLERVGV